MSDTLFDLSTAALTVALNQVNGISIVYERNFGGEYFTILATAAMSKTTESVLDSDGAAVEYEVIDFILDAAELISDDVVITPLAGDIITLADSSIYEVSLDANAPAYRWCDSNKKRLRIHTKPQGIIGAT